MTITGSDGAVRYEATNTIAETLAFISRMRELGVNIEPSANALEILFANINFPLTYALTKCE